MKILVTGANGYLGRGVVDELLKRGNEVIATDFACDHVNSAALLDRRSLYVLRRARCGVTSGLARWFCTQFECAL